MIHVEPVEEPDDFDKKVRQKGESWLEKPENVKKRLPDYWTECYSDLRDAFKELCGYGAMYLPEGTVDHYLSKKNHRNLAYEWDNYRFISSRINSSKGTKDASVLDPFEVEDGWFRIDLPSLNLLVTDAIPSEHRSRAEYTLSVLKLQGHSRIIKQRAEWYKLHKEGELTINGLLQRAPLLACAVKAWTSEHPNEPLP